jgi:hypothetical protein
MASFAFVRPENRSEILQLMHEQSRSFFGDLKLSQFSERWGSPAENCVFPDPSFTTSWSPPFPSGGYEISSGSN